MARIGIYRNWRFFIKDLFYSPFLVQFGASMGIKAVLAAGTDEAHVALDKVFHGFLQCLI